MVKNPETFEKQLNEILDASSGIKTPEAHSSTENRTHGNVEPATHPMEKHSLPAPGKHAEIVIRIIAVITVLLLLYLFGNNIALR